jgi:hypothetical protein
MGNKRKTAATTASTDYALSAWKPVEVHLDGDASEIAPTNEEDETNATNNHYDNTKLSRKAKRDLPVNPGEDVAMFYGLEVLDASQYQLVQDGNTKRLVVINEEQKKMNQKEEETKNKSNESTTTTTAITKKAKKQKAKEESAAAAASTAAADSRDSKGHLPIAAQARRWYHLRSATFQVETKRGQVPKYHISTEMLGS